MYDAILNAHVWAVRIFLLLFLVKSVVLWLGRYETLKILRRYTLALEILVDVTFLGTGIYLAFESVMIYQGYWFVVKLILVALLIPIGIVAFKRQQKLLALLGLLIILYLYGLSEVKSLSFKQEHPEAPVTETTESPDTEAPLGKRVYDRYCKMCHGADGKMGGSGAANLHTSELDMDETLEVVREGRKSMLSYKDKLSKEEIEAVADYTHALRKTDD